MSETPPPLQVVDAFGLTGNAAPTHMRGVWRVGSVALKRVRHQAAIEWLADLFQDKHPAPDFRLAAPIAAADGRWVVEGWAASSWRPGTEDGSRWREILRTADRFHDWLSDLERPGWLDDTDDPWRAADRMAWDEQPVDVLPGFVRLVERLAIMRKPIDTANQLVHGDLTGNVLFAAGLAPGIIDVTLYWPARLCRGDRGRGLFRMGRRRGRGSRLRGSNARWRPTPGQSGDVPDRPGGNGGLG